MTPFSDFVFSNIKNSKLRGVEVGVRDGLNASYLMTYLPLKHLFLVDNFPAYDDYGRRLWTVEDQKEEFQKLIKVVLDKEYRDKAVLIYKSSMDARDLFLNFKPTPYLFDFVYIDANHSYESVAEDLKWWDLVIPGGIIGGHDYGTVDGDGVKKAVDEFVENNSLKLNVLDVSRDGMEWAIIKT